LAKLALFFCACFLVLFLVMSGARFLALRLEWAGEQADLVDAARWGLSVALYGGMLLGLAYTVLERVFAPAAVLCLVALSLGFVVGIGHGLESVSPLPGAHAGRSLGSPGLILSHRPYGTTVVLLRGPDEPSRARVAVFPDGPMVFQEEFAGLAESLPSAPFNIDTPWFLRSVAVDLRLSAGNLRDRLAGGSLPLYAGSLAFFLSSLLFVLRLGAWPLANFFLGILAFRGVLALETLFNSREVQDVFAAFLQDRLPASLAVPAIFLVAGLLAHLFSLLKYLAKRQGRNAAV